MTERRVDLDLNTPAFTQHESADGLDKRQRPPADEADRERFERALQRDAGRPAADGPSSGRVADSPFSLFGATAPQPASQTTEAGGRRGESPLSGLDGLLDRLMVGEGGHGGKMVRMALADDLLPGVSISISEAEGGWLVLCECSNDDNRERLCARVRELASEMANRLKRETVWRITTDDPEDLRPVEARAAPGGGS